MAAMAFIFQLYDPLVKIAQLLLQLLNFVLNGEARSRNSIVLFSGLSPIASRLPVLARRVVMACSESQAND